MAGHRNHSHLAETDWIGSRLAKIFLKQMVGPNGPEALTSTVSIRRL